MKFIYIGFGVMCNECGQETRAARPDDRFGQIERCARCNTEGPIIIILRVRAESEELMQYAYTELRQSEEMLYDLLNRFMDD